MFSTIKIFGNAAHGRRLDSYARGSAHIRAKTDEPTVARAKAMLRDAKRVEVFAHGEMDRIAAECGMSTRALLDIHRGLTWKHVEPTPANETEEN